MTEKSKKEDPDLEMVGSFLLGSVSCLRLGHSFFFSQRLDARTPGSHFFWFVCFFFLDICTYVCYRESMGQSKRGKYLTYVYKSVEDRNQFQILSLVANHLVC